MKPTLRIVTKLIKSDFDKGINEMKNDAKNVSNELNKGGEATQGMADGIKESAGAMIKIALIIGAIVVAVKAIAEATKKVISNNDELANKVAAIQAAVSNLMDGLISALGNVLKPIIEWIVNAIYTLLAYINAISEAWFNFSLFTNKSKKDVEKTNKAAKQLKKTLAGFDTANILSSGSTGGASASTGEEQKPITFPQIEIPAWLQWIIDNKDLIIGIIMGIGAAFALVTGNIPVLLGILGAALITWWEPISNFFIGLGQWLWDNIIVPIGNIIGKIIEKLNPVWEFLKTWFGTIYKNIKTTIDNIGKVISGIIQVVKNVYEKVKPWIDKILGLYKTIYEALYKAYTWAANTIINAIVGTFKVVFNALMKAIESVINAPIKAINKLIDTINKIPGIDLGRLNTFNLPRLAKGGIVNNPGAGVVMGNYIAGERGPEAVLPLTDDTLQRLANMIPITIDLTNKLDSRIIGNRIVEINKDKSFARNGV